MRVDVNKALSVNICKFFQFFHLGHEFGKHDGSTNVGVAWLQIVLNKHQIAVLDVGDELSCDCVRAFWWEQDDDNEKHNDNEIITNDWLERRAVAHVIVMQLNETRRILQHPNNT